MVVEVGIFGAGRMAGALVSGLRRSERGARRRFALGSLWARRTSHARALAGEASHFAEVAACDLVILAVRDAAIEEVAGRLAEYELRAGQTVVHCSGALGLAPLAAVEMEGVQTAVFHPLRSLPGHAASLEDARCVLHGAHAARTRLLAFAGSVGADALWVEDLDSLRYHAAASLASNGVTALLDAASRLIAEASGGQLGLPDVIALATSATDGLRGSSAEAALTGPIPRGDVDVVRGHLGALRSSPDATADLYRAVMRVAVDVAGRAGGGLDASSKRALRAALDAGRARR